MNNPAPMPHEYIDLSNAPILCRLLSTHPGLADEIDAMALVCTHAGLSNGIECAQKHGAPKVAEELTATSNGTVRVINAITARIKARAVPGASN